jgi:preprotein translocase subunit YajC
MLFLNSVGSSSNYSVIFMWVAILAVFYFMIIRPQQKKQKQQVKFLSNLSKGDQVLTNSGIIGKISKIEDQIVTLQVDTKTFLKITKSSISSEMTEDLSKNDTNTESSNS